jgi:hypothetical protein
MMLAGNLDLFRSAAPKEAHNKGSRLGEQSQGLPLDGEPRLAKWKEQRSGATSGEAGECFAVNKDAALAVRCERGAAWKWAIIPAAVWR